jgi:type II secretory pathway pseudopilin PulG
LKLRGRGPQTEQRELGLKEKGMEKRREKGPAARGYTMVELLVVMSIIMLLVTLVLLSISTMLRGSRMSNTVHQFIASADEARTAGLTFRRTVQVDLTRLDEDGKVNRLTTIGANILDPFEAYTYNPEKTSNPLPSTYWKGTAAGKSPEASRDGSQIMLVKADQGCYSPMFRMDTLEDEDFEVLLEARVKLKPAARVTKLKWGVKLAGCVDSNSPLSGPRYALSIYFTFAANNPVNTTQFVSLERSGTEVKKRDLNEKLPGGVLQTLLREGIWYRMKLSIKRYDRIEQSGTRNLAWVAGKIWVDQGLEPPEWTVGPWEDNAPLEAGFAGFDAVGNDVYVDDAFFDLRSIRQIPEGMRVDTLFSQDEPGKYEKGDIVKAGGISPFAFPLIFRPDGTAAKHYVIRLLDTNSGDMRYVSVEQNTGRARPADTLEEALLK